jgi:hypothetical protein
MKILTNGGSLSRGPGSWPYWVQQAFDAELVNLSQSGAGNTYIHETTIAELAQRDYDLVLIQWTPFVRFDFKVQDISKFKNTIYTSEHQCKQNDWPEKVIVPINDQDYVEKNWVFGCGVSVNKDSDPTLNDAIGGFYRYSSPSEHMYHATMKIISLQSFLQVKKIPYLFVFGRPFKVLDRYSHLRKLIDWEHAVTDHYILDMTEAQNSWDTDKIHPSREIYQEFAELIVPRIKKIIHD